MRERGRTSGSYFGRVIERLRNFGKVGSEREFMNHMTQIHHYPCCISFFATSPNQDRGGGGGTYEHDRYVPNLGSHDLEWLNVNFQSLF